jgi:hypothetical protein
MSPHGATVANSKGCGCGPLTQTDHRQSQVVVACWSWSGVMKSILSELVVCITCYKSLAYILCQIHPQRESSFPMTEQPLPGTVNRNYSSRWEWPFSDQQTNLNDYAEKPTPQNLHRMIVTAKTPQ